MAKGILEKKLVEKRNILRAGIVQLVVDEKANSAVIHRAMAAKSELTAKIIAAKNELLLLEQHIKDCEELPAVAGRGIPT